MQQQVQGFGEGNGGMIDQDKQMAAAYRALEAPMIYYDNHSVGTAAACDPAADRLLLMAICVLPSAQ